MALRAAHTIDTILRGYKGFGCFDKRLTETSVFYKGCEEGCHFMEKHTSCYSCFWHYAWSRWKDAGEPRAGPLFEAMLSTKNDVKTYVRKCRAKEQRINK